MNPAEIFEVVQNERKYQNKKWAHLDPKNTVAHYSSYITNYAKAADDAVKAGNEEECLHQMRKVMALCQACFEQYGCPERKV